MDNDYNDFDRGKAGYDKGNYAEAFCLLMPFAERGVPEAQCLIGSMYHLGLGIEANGTEAVKWYSKAGEQGYAPANNNLGCLYTTGMPDVPVDPDKARQYYHRAAEQGFDMIPKEWYET